jgi:hypothetical protein
MALPRIGKTQLAQQLKLSPQWTSRIVNGWANATQPFTEACSQALDMPIDELFRPGGHQGGQK